MNRRRPAPRPVAAPAGDIDAALVAGLAELGLATTTSAPQRQQLLAFLRLLERWNQVYNLTALRQEQAMLGHHLLDCLAVLPALARQVATQDLSILDVGSGGGLPGVVLAVMWPKAQVTCVDTVAKKAAFIRQVSAELALPNLKAVHARVENMAQPGGGFQIITARAFSALGELIRLTQHLLAPAGLWMAMKGQVTPSELASVPPEVDVFHVEPLVVPGLDAQRHLVWMRAHGAHKAILPP